MTNTTTTLHNAEHSHNFNAGNNKAQKAVLYATILTFAMMFVEIIGGYIYNSMALLADGWHMSSHALALGIAFFAYIVANRYANDTRFCFGTYKIEVLSGYTSAILLVLVAVFMAQHCIERLINPVEIAYKEAISIAFVGLFINLVCAYLLRDSHDHHHDHSHHRDHSHSHNHAHEDLNLKGAYLHILADALTSVLAIIALCGGMLFDIVWLDCAMGIFGSILVLIWAINLIKETCKILLDANMNDEIAGQVTKSVQEAGLKILDLHISKVSKEKYALVLSLSRADTNLSVESIKTLLMRKCERLAHISVEME